MTKEELARELKKRRAECQGFVERDARQSLCATRVVECWGAAAYESVEERAMRLFEEAAEVMQALDVPREKLDRLLDVVGSRAKGEIKQELGGVCVTLLVLAQRLGASLDAIELDEIERFLTLPTDYFRRKGAEKNALGVSIAPPIKTVIEFEGEQLELDHPSTPPMTSPADIDSGAALEAFILKMSRGEIRRDIGVHHAESDASLRERYHKWMQLFWPKHLREAAE
jgi:hypothetical protein